MRTQQLFIQAFISFILLNSNNITSAQSLQTQSPEAQQALQKTDRLYFIENKGQWDSDVLYLCRMGGLDAWITKYGVNYTFYKVQYQDADQLLISSTEPAALEQRPENDTLLGHRILFELEGHNPEPGTESLQQQSGYYNYLIGNDPGKHAANVSLYKEVVVKDVYHGIDVRYYFDRGYLRFDYIVHAGANPDQIKFALKGSDSEYLEDGALCYTTRFGEVQLAELKTTQASKEIQSHFVHNGDVWQISLAAYDTKQPLIIDPLVYSTYIGGSSDDRGYGIEIDPSGNAYITGYTNSSNYDVNSGVFQTTLGGGYDVFVTKLNPDGTTMIYFTYIGGTSDDYGQGIDIDISGNAYITVHTTSSDFDVTSGAFQTTFGGAYDCFVTKLNSAGTALFYSTYIGGNASDYSNRITINPSGNAYITGISGSTDYDVTSGAFQTTHGGGVYDVIVTKLNPDGTALVYSTYIGGSSSDFGRGIAIDPSGNAYIVGQTVSSDYDVTSGSYQTASEGGWDAFITKLESDGTALVYSTYIGGSNSDYGYGITLDPSGNAYITGYTGSTDYDVTSTAFQTTFGGAYDVFMTKLNPTGTALVYSTYIGGSNGDFGNEIAIDASGNAYTTGYTGSSDYDVTSGAFQTTFGGGFSDVFVTKLNHNGTGLVYSTYIGGSNNDEALGITIDPFGNTYITGSTNSTDYDVTLGAFQTINGGDFDVFVTKLDGLEPLAIDLVSFTAERSDNVVQIKWATAAEKNHDYFIVERSTDAVSGDFIGIGRLDGRGDNTAIAQYSLTDKQPTMGNNYYRLKSIDKSGITEYSKIALVHFDSDIFNIHISPNPTNCDFKIHFASKQRNTYYIAMYDNMGQLVFQQDYLSNAGANGISMSPDNLSQGAYTVHEKDDFGHSVTNRLVITK
ncbi:MAG: T9SS type A sorting domain-containing protein [Bacteroidia bacterium]|nr:MAG: T9SS type A sorting domain-containing protein [Bacteroidia bacterium]